MKNRIFGSAAAALLLGVTILGATGVPSIAQSASGGGSGGGAVQGGSGAPGGGTGVPGAVESGNSGGGIGESTTGDQRTGGAMLMQRSGAMGVPSMQSGNGENEPAGSDQ